MGSCTSKEPTIYVRYNIENFYERVNEILGFDHTNCPRYRSTDVYISKPLFVVRGRCGAGNREEYKKEIKWMKYQKYFTRNWEWEDDCTYMYFSYDLKNCNSDNDNNDKITKWAQLVYDFREYISVPIDDNWEESDDKSEESDEWKSTQDIFMEKYGHLLHTVGAKSAVN